MKKYPSRIEQNNKKYQLEQFQLSNNDITRKYTKFNNSIGQVFANFKLEVIFQAHQRSPQAEETYCVGN